MGFSKIFQTLKETSEDVPPATQLGAALQELVDLSHSALAAVGGALSRRTFWPFPTFVISKSLFLDPETVILPVRIVILHTTKAEKP